ncbi:MAG: OB-fold nucleic acid binding domain-containing protein, partial [Candidatus Gastranaerophilaceae bacterium]
VNKRLLEGLIKAGAFSTIEKSRKQLLENMDYITSSVSRDAKAREMGQVSLFSALPEDDSFLASQFQLGGSDEEFEDKQIQLFEKEFLGFYVTSHPLFSIRDKLPFLMTHKVSELDTIKEDASVTVCGLITAARQIPTKKDPTKFIKFMTLEDLTGKVELVAFNKTIQEYNDFLQVEQKVIISGKVQHRTEEQTSILIDNVKPVDNSNLVTITVKQELKYEELCAIKNILAAHHGSDPVLFNVLETNDRILTASMFWVSASNELVNHLKKLFTEKQIDIAIKSMDTPTKAENNIAEQV